MKIIVKDVELTYDDVSFNADVEVEIDEETGEKTVAWAYAREDVPHPNWRLKAGDRFDPGEVELQYLFEPDLDVPLTEVFTSSEAEEKWGLQPGTVRSSCTRGKLKEYIKKGQVKKSGNTWLVTKKAMEEVYGFMKPTHVFFSNQVGAPGDKITLREEEIFFKVQEIKDAENAENFKYAHYYYAQHDEYGNTEYIYVATENAKEDEV